MLQYEVHVLDNILIKKQEFWEELSPSTLQSRVIAVLTRRLIPWNIILLEKLTVPQLVKKSPAFYGARRFITALTSAGTCPYPKPDES